jgi:hypothetical protein
MRILSKSYGVSTIGPKRTLAFASHMSALGGKADMTFCSANVRL